VNTVMDVGMMTILCSLAKLVTVGVLPAHFDSR
jgi:hypothetical protein